MQKKSLNPIVVLTDTELEMMNIVWRIGPCSVTQMLTELPEERKLAYTSVSTMVRILEQKGFVTAQKEGRGHLYLAAVSKEEYQQKSVQKLITNVFDGTPTSLVRQLLAANNLSLADIQEIKALLNKRST